MTITVLELVEGIREVLYEMTPSRRLAEEQDVGNIRLIDRGNGAVLEHWDAGVLGPLPDEPTLIQKAASRAARLQAIADETTRLAQVVEDARSAVAAIPGWATWTQAEVNQWIDDNLATELAAQPKTLTAIRAIAKMLIALRNNSWADMEGGS